MSEPPSPHPPSAARSPAEIGVPGKDGFWTCPSGRALYCVTHTPPAGVTARGTLVFLQAFTEERKASHRTAVRLGSALAAAGVTTHRLDLPGCGESTGRLAALTWTDWLNDAAAAADELLSAAPADQPRYLGGIRIGATVAGLCRPAIDAANRRLTWLAVAPILQGAGYLHNLRTRRSIRGDLTQAATASAAATGMGTTDAPSLPPGSEEFDGFLMNADFLHGLEGFVLPRDLTRAHGAVIQAGPARSVTKEFQPLTALPGQPFTVIAVRQEPVWERGEATNDRPLIEAVLQAVGG